MFSKFTNEAGAAAPAEASSGVIRGPRSATFAAVLLDGAADPLPAPARERLTALINRLENASAVSRSLTDRKVELIAEKQRWSARLHQLRGDGLNRPTAAADHPAVREATILLERAERELDVIQDRIDEGAAARSSLAHVIRRCESWVKQLDTKVEIVKASPPKLSKGESVLEGIDRIRRELAELRADRNATIAAPVPASQAKATMRRLVADIAARGKPDVDSLIEGAGEIGWPMPMRSSPYLGYALARDGGRMPVITEEALATPDAMALLFWMNEPAIVKRLEAEIDACADDGSALSDDTRRKKIAQIDANALELEYGECLLVGASNGAVGFRADTDPRALLFVSGPAPKTE